MTRLEWVLRRAGIRRLLACGIVTNGGVASTLRDAHVRDFSTVLLSDGCAAFDARVHEATVAELSSVSSVMTCADFVTALGS
jgi:nicotinamidase-related amidase